MVNFERKSYSSVPQSRGSVARGSVVASARRSTVKNPKSPAVRSSTWHTKSAGRASLANHGDESHQHERRQTAFFPEASCNVKRAFWQSVRGNFSTKQREGNEADNNEAESNEAEGNSPRKGRLNLLGQSVYKAVKDTALKTKTVDVFQSLLLNKTVRQPEPLQETVTEPFLDLEAMSDSSDEVDAAVALPKLGQVYDILKSLSDHSQADRTLSRELDSAAEILKAKSEVLQRRMQEKLQGLKDLSDSLGKCVGQAKGDISDVLSKLKDWLPRATTAFGDEMPAGLLENLTHAINDVEDVLTSPVVSPKRKAKPLAEAELLDKLSQLPQVVNDSVSPVKEMDRPETASEDLGSTRPGTALMRPETSLTRPETAWEGAIEEVDLDNGESAFDRLSAPKRPSRLGPLQPAACFKTDEGASSFRRSGPRRSSQAGKDQRFTALISGSGSLCATKEEEERPSGKAKPPRKGGGSPPLLSHPVGFELDSLLPPLTPDDAEISYQQAPRDVWLDKAVNEPQVAEWLVGATAGFNAEGPRTVSEFANEVAAASSRLHGSLPTINTDVLDDYWLSNPREEESTMTMGQFLNSDEGPKQRTGYKFTRSVLEDVAPILEEKLSSLTLKPHVPGGQLDALLRTLHAQQATERSRTTVEGVCFARGARYCGRTADFSDEALDVPSDDHSLDCMSSDAADQKHSLKDLLPRSTTAWTRSDWQKCSPSQNRSHPRVADWSPEYNFSSCSDGRAWKSSALTWVGKLPEGLGPRFSY